MSADNFQIYASYYNLLYKDKDYKAEADYIASVINKFSKGRVSSLLNLGCGTGNHDILFAELGYSVYGVDLSEGMIRSAKKNVIDKNLADKLQFAVGDIRDFRLHQKFDSVISLFHVMSYQTSNIDLEKVFLTAAEHLKEDGLFLFDCWYGPAVVSDPPVNKIKEVEDNLIHVHRSATPVIHAQENIVDVNFEIKVTNKSDGTCEQFNELHSMRYLFDAELEVIGTKTGFSKLSAYKWLTFEKPSDKSWNVIFIFKKQK